MMTFTPSRFLLLSIAGLLLGATTRTLAFHIPHTRHHNPLYVRYHLEKLDQNHNQQQGNVQGGAHSGQCHHTTTRESCPTDTISNGMKHTRQEDSSSDFAQIYNQKEQQQVVTISPEACSISTPVSYDEETGMVQTAVRAIVDHPVTNFVDNSLVGASSTLVISLGAIHELVDCLEVTWAHHATASTEGLAILSLGHFLHYGRETLRQIVEMHDENDLDEMDETKVSNEPHLINSSSSLAP